MLKLALAACLASGVLSQHQHAAVIDFESCSELNKQIAAIAKLSGANITPFDCATLSVPLDYTKQTSGRLDLQVFKVNATAEPVLGTVLINFGGPGGTGAELLPI